MQQIIRVNTQILYVLICLLGLAACDGDSGSTPQFTPPPSASPAPINRTASFELAGLQENPAVKTSASGSAVLTLELNSGTLTGSITTSVVNVTAAHIHSAFAGMNGDIILTLDQSSDDASRWLVPDNTVLTAIDAFSFLNGELYVNVHSDINPAGELRGQVLLDNFTLILSDLTGAAEVPATSTLSSGRAALTVNTDTLAMVLNATSDVPDATAAHIHENFAGANGAVIIPLDQDANNIGNFSISETFTQAQYDSLIHSATTPSGELRAQLLPDNITVIVNDLTGDAEVPAVTSASSGRASLTVNTDTLAMVLNANSDVPDATAAHIHENFGRCDSCRSELCPYPA